MDTTFEKCKNTTDEWYTPKEIIDALGKFDLDPCAPINPLWKTATQMYNKNDDGLIQQWKGRVWLNPPYSVRLLNSLLGVWQSMETESHYFSIVAIQRCFRT